MRGRVLALLLAAAPAALAVGTEAPALAQSASDIAAAKQLFSEGLALEGKEKWVEAREKFTQVEGVKQTSQVAFHLGICNARAGALVEAVVWLERARERSAQMRTPDVDAAAEAELKKIRPRLGTLDFSYPKGKPTKVTVDGEPSRTAAQGGPVLVNPGEHEVVVDFASGPVRVKTTLAEGQAYKLAPEPPKGGAVEPASTTPIAPPAAEPVSPGGEPARDAGVSTGGHGPGALPWILVGVGGAALVGGAVFMGLREGEFGTISANCTPTCSLAKRAEIEKALDAGKTDTYVGVALLGAGAVAAGVGVFLLVTAPSGSKASGATSLPGASGVPEASGLASLRGAPVALPGGGGLVLDGRF